MGDYRVESVASHLFLQDGAVLLMRPVKLLRG